MALRTGPRSTQVYTLNASPMPPLAGKVGASSVNPWTTGRTPAQSGATAHLVIRWAPEKDREQTYLPSQPRKGHCRTATPRHADASMHSMGTANSGRRAFTNTSAWLVINRATLAAAARRSRSNQDSHSENSSFTDDY